MTDEALDQYTRQVLLDALRVEWDDTGQSDAFTPSKKYQSEMRELVANPEAWYKKKTEPPWRRYVRRLSALAAVVAVCVAAVWFLPNGGEAAAHAPFAIGGIWGVALAVAALVINKAHKK